MAINFRQHLGLMRQTNPFYRDSNGDISGIKYIGSNYDILGMKYGGNLTSGHGEVTILEVRNGMLDAFYVEENGSTEKSIKTTFIVDGVSTINTFTSDPYNNRHYWLMYPMDYNNNYAFRRASLPFQHLVIKAQIVTGPDSIECYVRYRAETFVSAWSA